MLGKGRGQFCPLSTSTNEHYSDSGPLPTSIRPVRRNLARVSSGVLTNDPNIPQTSARLNGYVSTQRPLTAQVSL